MLVNTIERERVEAKRMKYIAFGVFFHKMERYFIFGFDRLFVSVTKTSKYILILHSFYRSNLGETIW